MTTKHDTTQDVSEWGKAHEYAEPVVRDIGITLHVAKESNSHIKIAIKGSDQNVDEVRFMLLNDDDIRDVIKRLKMYLGE